jgi:hypothetical protein
LAQQTAGASTVDRRAVVREARSLFDSYNVIEEDAEVGGRLLTLVEAVQFPARNIYDVNTVASMPRYGVTEILTNGLADFAALQEYITILPL